MPVKIGTLLTSIAQRIGLATDTPEFIELLAANLEVPDTLAQAFTAPELMTLEAARNNPKLKSHFYATSLNEIDRRITGSMDELEFPDEMKTDILAVTSTFDRINLFGKKIKELEARRNGASGQEKTALTAQINELQRKLGELTQASQLQYQSLQQAHSAEISDLILTNMISGRKLDTTKFPSNVMQNIARNFLDQEMQRRGIKLANTNKVLSLKQAQSPDLDYYHNNQPYTIDQLIDEVLANNNLLQIIDPPPVNPAGNNGNQQQQRQNPGGSNGSGQQQQQPLNGMLGKLDRIAANMNKVNGTTN